MVATTMNYTYDPQRSWHCVERGPTEDPSLSPSESPSVSITPTVSKMPSPAPTTPCLSILGAGEILYSDQEPRFICSPNGMYRFGIDATDNDLALWRNETKTWSAGTAACCDNNEVFLIMQGMDGNLVLREGIIRDGHEQRLAIWASQTSNLQYGGAYLSLGNDGIARIGLNETQLWSTEEDVIVSGSSGVTDAPTPLPTLAPTPFSCDNYKTKDLCKEHDKRCKWKKKECIND